MKSIANPSPQQQRWDFLLQLKARSEISLVISLLAFIVNSLPFVFDLFLRELAYLY